MRPISRKIYFVIVMLVAALGVSTAIYFRGGFSIAGSDNVGYCGTADPRRKIIINPVAANGEKLFKANCTSCHAMDKTLTGPALNGVRERMSDKLFEDFLLHPKTTLSKSKYLQKLYIQFDNMPHISFLGTLTKEDIDAIIMYCDTSEPMFETEAMK